MVVCIVRMTVGIGVAAGYLLVGRWLSVARIESVRWQVEGSTGVGGDRFYGSAYEGRTSL